MAQPAAGPAGTAASLVAAAGWRHAYDQCAEAIKASHTEILAKLRAPPPTSKVPALTIPPPSEENLQRATRHPPNPGCEAACRHSDVGLNPATTGTSTTRHSYHFPGMVPIDTPFPSHSSTPIGDRGREAGSTRPSNVSVFPGDPRCRTCVGTAAVTVPTGVESSGSSMVSLHKTRLSSWGSEASIPAHQARASLHSHETHPPRSTRGCAHAHHRFCPNGIDVPCSVLPNLGRFPGALRDTASTRASRILKTFAR